MKNFIKILKTNYPGIKFEESDSFYWSPDKKIIFYKQNKNEIESTWAILHELGHALLGHINYGGDYSLLRKEAEAWEEAKKIAKKFSIKINEDHIQDCLDTYRDWIYKRSICPKCSTKCLQKNDFNHYVCHNCHTQWKVTSSRFCRAYRISKYQHKQKLLI